MAAAAILYFLNYEILLANKVRESRCISILPNLVKIGCEDIKIFRFLKMAAVAIL